MTPLAIDLDKHPNRHLRIGAFAVSEAACNQFEAAMGRNRAPRRLP